MRGAESAAGAAALLPRFLSSLGTSSSSELSVGVSPIASDRSSPAGRAARAFPDFRFHVRSSPSGEVHATGR
jgi:hypothetical protein